MAIKQSRNGRPGSEQGMGVSVGAQAGNSRQEGRNEGHLGRRARPDYGIEQHAAAHRENRNDAGTDNSPTGNSAETDESDADEG